MSYFVQKFQATNDEELALRALARLKQHGHSGVLDYFNSFRKLVYRIRGYKGQVDTPPVIQKAKEGLSPEMISALSTYLSLNNPSTTKGLVFNTLDSLETACSEIESNPALYGINLITADLLAERRKEERSEGSLFQRLQ